MRVIGGEFRSRRLKSVEGVEVRPTPDRLRETLFNVIAPRIDGALFVDAYAGTGAVGIEALSRGARRVVFIEKNRVAAEVIAENLAALGAQARALVVRGSVKIYLGAQRGEIVFVDPPYELEGEYRSAMNILGEGDAALVVAQHERRLVLDEKYGRITKYREIRQGDNVLSFYAPAGANDSDGEI